MSKMPTGLMIIFFTLILSSCIDNSQNKNKEDKVNNDPVSTVDLTESDYDGSKITLNKAIEKGYASISADGLGTFTKINIVINNHTQKSINLIINGGILFKNPDPTAQSLIVIDKIGDITIDSKNTFDQVVRTVCTDVSLNVPGKNKNWQAINNNNNESIDEILMAYAKYKEQITAWLKRKNPSKFKTEEDQHRFLQILVWAYKGGDYNQILNMLAKDVYNGDLTKAREWLDGLYEQAVQITSYVKQNDYKGLLVYLGIPEYGDKIKKGKKYLNNLLNQ